jgi:hypothetical protein
MDCERRPSEASTEREDERDGDTATTRLAAPSQTIVSHCHVDPSYCQLLDA